MNGVSPDRLASELVTALLAAGWEPPEPPKCNSCGNPQAECDCSRCYMWRYNEESRAGAHQHGQIWSQSEEDVVLRTDLTRRDKAEMLGRTRFAVAARERQLRAQEVRDGR